MKKLVFIGVLVLSSLLSIGQNQVSEEKGLDSDYQIFKKLHLNPDQKNIVAEISENKKEIKEMELAKDSINKALSELHKIKDMSKQFSDIYKKAVKRINDLEMQLADLEYDIESYKEITYNLEYQIYKSKLNKDRVKKYNADKFLDKATYFAGRANTLIENINNANDDDMLPMLKQANKFAEQAINSQKQALVLCYNIPVENINKEQEHKLLAESSKSDNKIDVKSIKQDKVTNKGIINNNDFVASNSDFTINTQKTISYAPHSRITYKVQIGAFVNDISEDEFKGLKPITKDTLDQYPFAKFMVGNYTSFKAAQKARDIITRNTEYKDAFIVAYDGNERIPLSAALNSDYTESKYLSEK